MPQIQERFLSEEREIFRDTDKAATKFTGCKKPCYFDQYKIERNIHGGGELHSEYIKNIFKLKFYFI